MSIMGEMVATPVSILKSPYLVNAHNNERRSTLNKVRFEIPHDKRSLYKLMTNDPEKKDVQSFQSFILHLQNSNIKDAEFTELMNDARKILCQMEMDIAFILPTLLNLPWTHRNDDAANAYNNFFMDVMVVHSSYIGKGIQKLLSYWIPKNEDMHLWKNGVPQKMVKSNLEYTHKLLDRLLSTIPMSINILLEEIESSFPYYKRPAHIVAGYLHNVLWLMEYQPNYTKPLLQMILNKMVFLDVYTPRNEIEEIETVEEDDDDNESTMSDEKVEQDESNTSNSTMSHSIAQSLNVCMEMMLNDLASRRKTDARSKALGRPQGMEFLQMLLHVFENVILPTHNTHHVQFLLFYFCSFQDVYTETFLTFLWSKITNPSTPAVIRQTSVDYMASFLSRSEFLPSHILKDYLKKLCDWAHDYVQTNDRIRCNAVRMNLIFFSVCQAIFYIIAFRARELTSKKQNLRFLQSIHLQALVNSALNPLRVCLKSIATTFASVMRTHQIVYCHVILERNARYKLANRFTFSNVMDDELLGTVFPFDPYLLKLSVARFASIYLEYRPHICINESSDYDESSSRKCVKRRTKRDEEDGEEEEAATVEEFDDFFIPEKLRKMECKEEHLLNLE